MAPSVSPVSTSPFEENAMHDTYFGLWFFCWDQNRKGLNREQLIEEKEKLQRWHTMAACGTPARAVWVWTLARVTVFWSLVSHLWKLSQFLLHPAKEMPTDATLGQAERLLDLTWVTNFLWALQKNIVLNTPRCVSLAEVFDLSSFLLFKFGWLDLLWDPMFNQAGSSFTALQFV